MHNKIPTPPDCIPARLHVEWRALYRAFRSRHGGRESEAGAYWKATEFYTDPTPHLGAKAAFSLAVDLSPNS